MINVEIISNYLPAYQHTSDACVDLIGTECIKDSPDQQWFKTGVKLNIPDGYMGLVFSRSSISKKKLSLCNGVGVIDSGYQGEIQVRFNKTKKLCENPDIETMSNEEYNYLHDEYYYQEGERIAQLMILPVPMINFIPVDKFTEKKERGENGFGSTGN